MVSIAFGQLLTRQHEGRYTGEKKQMYRSYLVGALGGGRQTGRNPLAIRTVFYLPPCAAPFLHGRWYC